MLQFILSSPLLKLSSLHVISKQHRENLRRGRIIIPPSPKACNFFLLLIIHVAIIFIYNSLIAQRIKCQ